MREDQTVSDATTPRPRIEGAREDEILEAVVDVLLEVGYDKLTFDLVASKAHASKATLYRRWSGKAELVMAAVMRSKSCLVASGPLPDTGTLTGDLEAFGSRKETQNSRAADVVGAVAPALSRDAALREEFMTHFAQPKIDLYTELLNRAAARGELPAQRDIEILSHVVPALATHHTVVFGDAPSHEYMTRVVEHVLLPAAGVTSIPDPERRG